MSEESLVNHYNTNFQLMQHHNYSLSDLDNMIPYEREIYVTLLEQFIKQQKEEQELQNQQ
jgi:hypothetical protein